MTTDTQFNLYRKAYQQVRDLCETLHALKPYENDLGLYNFAVRITAKLRECDAEITYKGAVEMKDNGD